MKSRLTTLPRCIVGAAVVSLATLASMPAAAQTTALQSPPATTEAWPDPDTSLEPLGSLRRSAAVGDADAALAVATRLSDRYDIHGRLDDLFEAVIWIDRYQGSDAFANSGLIKSVQQKDCKQNVLRYHPLCDVAE